jgi:hypothetical protein
MYIAPRDRDILRSDELYVLKKEYQAKYGENFTCFNYADFHGTDDTPAAQFYLEALREAVKADQPYRIVSHRYDEFDH